MRRVLLLSLLAGLAVVQADRRVLRPCFERYPNHRLVNLRPYHSEWRMKAEDSCLLFCAQTASRCRSIVYDSVQHICHFFSEEGVDQAIISAKMVYLRVVAKTCLEDNMRGAEAGAEAPPAPTVLLARSYETPTTPFPTLAPIREEILETTTEVVSVMELDEAMSRMESSRSFEKEPQLDMADGERQVVEHSDKVVTLPTPPRATVPKGEPIIQISGDVEVPFNNRSPLNYPIKKSNVKSGAKIIKFDEDAAYRKTSEIRRMPMAERPSLKPVTLTSSYIEKAKSFIDSLTETEVVKTECHNDEVPVWVTFENSQAASEENDGVRMTSRSQCQKKCERENCRSYTFLEKRSRCVINGDNDGLTMKEPSSGPFSASVTTKFCYPKSFTVFETCTNFVGFRDYTLKTSSKEEFDGLPAGYEGLQLCMELCVLSNQYDCKSATFDTRSGKCSLLTEDSLSQPDDFKFSEDDNILYFENGCVNEEKETESSERRIEVVPVAVKPSSGKTLRSISIKPSRKAI